MRVSVLLPTFNQARFLPEALAGLAAQTFRNFELIACDDGSNDGTAEILRASDAITMTHNTNRGTAAAINTAAKVASGELMTWVSSDNVMEPEWLETMIKTVDANNAGAVYSAFWFETPDRPPHVLFREYDPTTLISDENCFFGPSFLIRADIWHKAGPHTGGISHDLGHWLRVEEQCWEARLPIVGIPVPLCHYRVHNERATVRLRHLYDAPKHHAEARARRS